MLVVVAIIGVLAVVIYLAINPAQQLARTRDAGRKSAISQLGRSLEAYATSHSGNYVPEDNTWITSLKNAGELSNLPAAIVPSISGASDCSTNAQNGYCYNASDASGAGPIVAYASMESAAENSRCGTGKIAYFVWSTEDSRGGVVCSSSEPIPGPQTFEP